MQWCEEPGWLDLPPRAATQCVGGATTAKTQVSQNYETFDMILTTNTNTNTRRPRHWEDTDRATLRNRQHKKGVTTID